MTVFTTVRSLAKVLAEDQLKLPVVSLIANDKHTKYDFDQMHIHLE